MFINHAERQSKNRFYQREISSPKQIWLVHLKLFWPIGSEYFSEGKTDFEIVEINRKYFSRKMKVDYGEILFQSAEGITEDQGMVQYWKMRSLRVIVGF